jgi:hypothetical protein
MGSYISYLFSYKETEHEKNLRLFSTISSVSSLYPKIDENILHGYKLEFIEEEKLLQISTDSKFKIKQSNLKTVFPLGKSFGLFTEEKLNKNTTLIISRQLVDWLNDPLIDLTEFLDAKTSQEMYTACCNLYANYYNLEKAIKLINVRLEYVDDFIYMHILNDVMPNEELYISYSFTVWISILLQYLNNKTLAGFIKFLGEIKDKLKGDVNEIRMIILHTLLARETKDYTEDLEEYDKNLEEKELEEFTKLFPLDKYAYYLTPLF